MKKVILLPGIIFFVIQTCYAQVEHQNFGIGQGKKILVAFFIDGKQIRIRNKFKLFFVNGKDTFATKIRGIRAFPPPIEKDSGYQVFFMFKNYLVSVDKVSRRMISADQDITWDFGIDNYPFHQNLYLLSDDEYRKALVEKKLKQIQYLKFDLMEYGDGMRIIKKVE